MESSEIPSLAERKLRKMLENGFDKFTWLHSGVPLDCNGEDHRKFDGKQFDIARYLRSGKTLPGASKGCRCNAIAFLKLR